ncbi:MAG TPA: PKD domain-containing protein, partial [Puia sp.]|nr:PKD domain-containing protein [Puia sp.]
MNRKLLLFLISGLLAAFVVNGQAPVPVFAPSATSVCPGTLIVFQNLTSPIPPGTSWYWNFGGTSPDVNPPSSSSPSPNVLFNTPGKYAVTLTAIVGTDSITSPITWITVNPIPTADFNSNDTTGCSPFTAQFTDASLGNGSTIVSWNWYFGDGGTATGKGPVTHTFLLPANYSVNLQVINNFGCIGTASLKTKSGYVVVTQGVIPLFNDSLSSSCKPPTTAFFSNQTTGPGTITYSWQFGDGGTSNQQSPAPHTYGASGSYPVILKATSNQGCSDTYTDTIKISSGSVQSSFTAPDSVCIGVPVTFNNTSAPPPNSSTWKFGDGNSITAFSPTYTYDSAGTYKVTLSNNFSSCSDSINKLIHVLNPPTPNFTALSSTTSCKPPLTVNFKDQSVGATSWSWDFGDGSTGSGPTPSHTYTSYGQFNVTLTVSNGQSCNNSVTKTQFVQVVKPSVRITNLPAFGCAPVIFSPILADTVVDGIASYFWDFGNGNTYTVANPPAQTYPAGKYPVKLTIVSTGGCSAFFVDTVKAGTVKPTAAFTAIPNPVCIGSPVSFTDQSTGGADQWQWDFGDGNSIFAKNTTHAYAQPGTYTVKLSAYNQGCFDTAVKQIKVNPPLAKFNYSFTCANKLQYTFTDVSIGPVSSWDWDFGDGGGHSNAQNPLPHTYASAGTYRVILTVTGVSCTNKDTQFVNVGQPIVFHANQNVVCVNSEVTISAVIGPNIASWLFDFGDGTRAGGCYCSNWPHIYTTPGVYDIKVITTDSSGCMDSTVQTKFITVNGPKANFKTLDTLGCGSITANFQNLSVSGPSPINQYFWDFGDNQTLTTSIPTSPSHLYNTQGIFPIKLRITDASGCSDSLIKGSYVVLSIPTAGFTTQDVNFCPSSLIKFTNTSTGGFNPVYTWNFGNGVVFKGTNPPLQNFPNIGHYTISLSDTDAYGCTANFVKPNYINIDTPSAAFSLSSTFASCPPLLDTFTFKGSYYKTFLWNFGPNEGVNNVTLNPTHLYGIPGTYSVSLTVTSPGGCTAISTQTIQLLGPGLDGFSYFPTGGCDTLTVNFNVITTGPVIQYTWYFGYSPNDSLVNNVPSARFTYPQSGSYLPFVRLVDSTGCGVVYYGSTNIVVDSVKANFVSDKNLLCQNGTIQFNNSSYLQKGTVISNYFWDFGDGNTINGIDSTPSHLYVSPGLYTVKMIVTTQNGCQDSSTEQIKVVANPVIGINGIVWQCVPATLNFSGVVLVPDTSAYTWLWDFDNGQNSTLQNPPSQTYAKAGHYVIKLTATNSTGCSSTDSSDLFIYPLPTIYAGADTTICLGQSLPLQATGGISYTWLPPSNSTLTCTNCPNPVATPPVSTSYYVTGTSPNGCLATDTIIVTVNQPVTVSVNPSADSVCIGQSAQLSASGAALYAWSPVNGLNNPNIANPVASPTTDTTYMVIGSDNKYCFSDTQYVQVSVFNYPTINVGPDQTILVGSSYQVPGTGSSDIVSINWL